MLACPEHCCNSNHGAVLCFMHSAFDRTRLTQPVRAGGIAAASDLRGCKKVRSMAGAKVSAIADLTTCPASQVESLDVQHILSHHAIPAGAPGSFACVPTHCLSTTCFFLVLM